MNRAALIRAPLVAAVLLAHTLILYHSASQKSATVDELSHLAGGLYAITTGDFRITRVDPPLQNVICAGFAAAMNHYQLDYDNECWHKGLWNGSGDRLMEANPENFHQLLMSGRMGSIALSVFLLGIVFFWARELWGFHPAFCVLLLAAFEPNLMAHGRLVTTDAATISFYTLTGLLTWRFYKRPSWKRLAAAGAAAGFAWLSKHSGLLLLPALFVIFAVLPKPSCVHPPKWLSQCTAIFQRFAIASAMTAVVCAAVFFTIWAGYGFEVGDSVKGTLPKNSALWSAMRLPLLSGIYTLGLQDETMLDPDDLHDPLWVFLSRYTPAFSHWEGFFATRRILYEGHLGYLMGRFSYRGFAEYYPVLFLIKTPIPLLMIFAAGAWLLITRRVTLERSAWVILLTIPAVYLTILILFNTAAIGYRHALPVLPYLLISCAGALAYAVAGEPDSDVRFSTPARSTGARWVFYALIAWSLFESLSLHPHYLTYFNEVIGGPRNGRFYAVDSNLDWGQDLLILKRYIREHDLGKPTLFYFGPKTLPDAYQVPHQILREVQPLPPGTYVISATVLQGVSILPWSEMLAPLRAREPDAYITPALYLYRIP
ncbi:MAG: hypothetical protein GC154_04975 [bacterium]|nr:hypothetical protein [bacterium]